MQHENRQFLRYSHQLTILNLSHDFGCRLILQPCNIQRSIWLQVQWSFHKHQHSIVSWVTKWLALSFLSRLKCNSKSILLCFSLSIVVFLNQFCICDESFQSWFMLIPCQFLLLFTIRRWKMMKLKKKLISKMKWIKK